MNVGPASEFDPEFELFRIHVICDHRCFCYFSTTAHDPCPAPDDGNVTESKTEVETKRVPTSGLPIKIDILSDTTTKRDELNNNEGNHMQKIANKILLSLSFRWVRL
ncbi:uncharacterized protein RHO17_005517 [Thomomys bottae]